MNSTRARLLLVGGGLLIAGGLSWAHTKSVATSYDFFSRELAGNEISTTSNLHGRIYTIRDGIPYAPEGTVARSADGLRALEIAYAQTLAQRRPLLGLSGNDTEQLARELEQLKVHLDSLASLQTSAQASEDIQRALYPIEFLKDLAQAENARRTFVSDGSENSLLIYEQSLMEALIAGSKDLDQFTTAYQREVGTETFRIPSFGGTLTSSSILLSLSSLKTSFHNMRTEAEHRSQCIRGRITECPTLTYLALPARTQTSFDSITSPTQTSLILRAAAATSTYDIEYTPVNLAQSTCLASLRPPYTLEVSTNTSYNFDLFHYLDNLFFISVGRLDSTVPRYLSSDAGFKYFQVNPFSFYLCSGVLEDISRFKATLETVRIARTYPDIPNSKRAALLSGPPSDRAAIAYLLEAQQSREEDSSYEQAISSATLMFSQKSAGLDALIGQMNYIYEHDLAIARAGAPFDFSARELFRTHAALQSLFLAAQLGAAPVYEPSTLADLQSREETYVPLSNILKTETVGTIIAELQRLAEFERQLH